MASIQSRLMIREPKFPVCDDRLMTKTWTGILLRNALHVNDLVDYVSRAASPAEPPRLPSGPT